MIHAAKVNAAFKGSSLKQYLIRAHLVLEANFDANGFPSKVASKPSSDSV